MHTSIISVHISTNCNGMDLSTLDDWLSDEDELICEYLEMPRFCRKVNKRSDLLQSLRDDEFVKRFRLRKQTAIMLLHEIEDKLLISDKNNAVSPINQLLCTLRYYATGSQLTACGDLIGIHESTACRILHRVTDAIARLYSKYIKMPMTETEQAIIVKEFYDIAKFPRVIGAIDCTHVRILSPGGDNAEIFRNRKGYFSINTQCICAANLVFLDVVSRWHGSAHDANIWDNCAQKRNFVQNVYNNKLLLGDSGYALTQYMMTPLPEISMPTRGEQLYQEAQIRTRNVIERAFGVWKRRFPILSKGINVRINRVPGIIIATAVLHNIAILQNDPVPTCEEELIPIENDYNGTSTAYNNNHPGNSARYMIINDYFARL